MEIIKSFDFDGKTLTVIDRNTQIWFTGNEVAAMLDYERPRKAIHDHVDEDDKKTIAEMGGPVLGLPENVQPATKIINESGLYSLIFASKKPIAKQFKRWVTSEVLPSIRKTGSYKIPEIKKYISYNQCLSIQNENDLHHAVISFINKYSDEHGKNIMMSIGMGEYLDSDIKRIDAFKKGYIAGSPDIIIHNKTLDYDGLLLELKTPRGTGTISEKQEKRITEYKEMKYKIIVSNDLCDIVSQLTTYFESIRIPCLYCSRRFRNKNTLNNHLKHFHRHEI